MMHQAEDIIFRRVDAVPIYYYVDIYMAQRTGKPEHLPAGLQVLHEREQRHGTLKVCTARTPTPSTPALNSAVDAAQ
jgi:hypothetical protein